MNNLFPLIQDITIVPDNARTHQSAFQQPTIKSIRRRRRRSPTAPNPSSVQPPQLPTRTRTPTPGSRWDSSSNRSRTDTLKTPRRSSGDESDSESSWHEELFLRPSNIHKCQSWPSPKDDYNSSNLVGTTGKSQDNLKRLALNGMRRKLASSLPILSPGRGVERASSLQDWFVPPSSGHHHAPRSPRNEWAGLPRGGGATQDSTAVLQSVFEALNTNFDDTAL